jgi:hypothetical protein
MAHDKFRAYWESIGKPALEVLTFNGHWDYRIKNDPHWELRRKWIDSNFTLPIETLTENGWVKAASNNNPAWFEGKEYREAKQVRETIGVMETALAERGPAVGQEFSRYFKPVQGLNQIDVYKVLELFDVKSHSIGHAVKKLLCAGERGTKGERQDVLEAIAALQRHIDMLDGK